MMGSVAGVGQFLETVGVPGPQVGALSGADNGTPGQDFASALQQAGGPDPRAGTGHVSGPEDAEVSAKNPASGAANAAVGNTKAASAGKSEAAVLTAPSLKLGQPLGSVGRGVSTAMPTANSIGSKKIQGGPAEPVETASAEPKESGATGETPVVSLSGTAKLTTDAGPAPVPARDRGAVVPVAGAVAVPLKSVALPGAIAKLVEQPKAENGKTAGKADASSTIDSKLTALVPQATRDVTQGANLTASTAPLPAAIAASPNISGKTGVTEAVNTPVAVASTVAPVRVAAVQAGGGKQLNSAAARVNEEPTTVETASAAAVSSLEPTVSGQSEVPARVSGAVPVVAQAAVASPTKTVVSTSPTAVGGTPVAIAAPAAPVAASQTRAEATLPAEQASAGFQAALQTTAPAEAVAASKVGSHGARGAATGVKAAVEATPASDAKAVAGPGIVAVKTPVASAAPLPVTAAPVVDHAGPANSKVGGKAVEGTAAQVQAATPSTKAAVTADGLSAPETPLRVSSDAGHVVVAAQPAGLAAEPVAAVALTVPVPAGHEAGAATDNVGGAATGGVAVSSGAASGVAASQEASGAAGLSHTTLSSTPTSLEVGVSSGTHGWLKIRAELNASGGVDASLTGATPAAAEKLRGELPALSNYLQDEKLTVGTLDVRSALHVAGAVSESGATFSQTGSGQGSAGQGSANQGGSGHANAGGATLSADAQSTGDGGGQSTPHGAGTAAAVSGPVAGDEVSLGRVSDEAVYANSIGLDDNAGASSVGYGAGGGWLNVRA